MDITIKVPALEKLLDYSVSGIGSTAGFLFAPQIAERLGKAKIIAANATAQEERILVESRSSSIQLIAEAQAKVRSDLVPADSEAQVELEMNDLIKQRIHFQETKRQANITSVVLKAGEQLSDKEVDDHDVDHDWTARFFSGVQDVSNEELQALWARVLADEVQRAGSVSIRALEILRNMDSTTARLFGRLCSLSIYVNSEVHTVSDARVPTLGGKAGDNALSEFGLGFASLNLLNESGLIIPDYNSWHDYNHSISLWPGLAVPQGLWILPFAFAGRYWVLEPTKQRPVDGAFKVNGVALTYSGTELYRVVTMEPVPTYADKLVQYFEQHSLRMVEVDGPEPRRA